MKPAAADFQQAVAAFQAQDYARAKKLCSRLIAKKQHLDDACHLMALLEKIAGDTKTAKQYFERSLAANPKQAVVCANFANLLAQLGEHDAANSMYARATELDNTLIDAWFNWATMLTAVNRHESAVQKADAAIAVRANEARLHIVRGIALRGLEEFDASVAAFDKAIELASLMSPMGVAATQNKAITLRSGNRPQEASASLAGLLSLKIENPEICFIKACAHYDAGEYAEAEDGLRRAIALRPDYVDAHEALNKLYWEQSDDQKFLESYKQNIAKSPESRELRYSYAAQLIMAGQKDAAKDVLQNAIAQFSSDANFVHALGVLMMGEGDIDEASRLFDEAIVADPNSARYRIDKANVLIRGERYDAALAELDHAGVREPLNQEVWAFRGLCWRLNGDERAMWLNNYEQLIDVRFLDAPEGYDNLEHFLHTLKADLQSLHKTQRQPLDQSVRNGTQTVGTLLTLPIKSIQDYRKVLSRSIQDYIEALPDDPEHPFLNRNTRAFVHSGSWSVKLGGGGFHTNHMHPQGWLSNCTYVSVPENIHVDDTTRAGWIRFGETSLQLGPKEQVGKAVCPKEGMRVLFPSFLWHGTYPFESVSPRITAPSDIMPKS